MLMSPHEEAPIVEFKTRQQREAELEAQDEAAYRDDAHAEAVSMLERALELAKTRKISGVAIAFVFDDGCYGQFTPTRSWNTGVLIGSVATAQQMLIDSTRDS